MKEFPTETPSTTVYIPLSEGESAWLIRTAGNRNPVCFAFGPSGVALEWRAGQPMPDAVRRLGMKRGVLNQNMEGAGI